MDCSRKVGGSTPHRSSIQVKGSLCNKELHRRLPRQISDLLPGNDQRNSGEASKLQGTPPNNQASSCCRIVSPVWTLKAIRTLREVMRPSSTALAHLVCGECIECEAQIRGRVLMQLIQFNNAILHVLACTQASI